MSEEFEAALRAYDQETERVSAAGDTQAEPARYAAARAGLARTLREIEVEAAELGLGSIAGLASWQAEQFERWTPFTAMAGSAFCRDYVPPTIPAGCYEASFGMVHVRPGCRCPRG